MQQALQLVRRELGPDAAVLRTREVRTGGMLGLFTGERGIEVEASAEVIVPSRLPRRPALLDQGIDLTEMAQLRLSVEHDQINDRRATDVPAPFHLVVAAAASRVGSTTIATNLATALNHQQLRTIVCSADHEFDRFTAPNFNNHSADGTAADVILFDVGSKPVQNSHRFWNTAGLVLLVVTPESKTILDGYAAIKHLSDQHPNLKFQTVVNLAHDETEAEGVHRQIAQTCRQFLNLEVTAAGFVPQDASIRRPLFMSERNPAARRFEQIAGQLAINGPINYLRFVSRKNLKFAESAIATGRY